MPDNVVVGYLRVSAAVFTRCIAVDLVGRPPRDNASAKKLVDSVSSPSTLDNPLGKDMEGAVFIGHSNGRHGLTVSDVKVPRDHDRRAGTWPPVVLTVLKL